MSTPTPTVVRVTVESEPHSEDLSGAVLNRPAPQGGSFLLDQRVPRNIWDQMRSAGASYWSADDLEELDMFDAPAGWRYSSAAIEVLLSSGGYHLSLRGETVTTVEQFRALWTTEAKAAYKARVEAERQAAEQARREARQRAEEQRQAAGAAYAAWQEANLAGLVYTTVEPPASPDWQHVYRAEKGTPGAWYDTGDDWDRADIDGQPVYRCYYGNAVRYYAPQALVDAWTLAKDDGSAAAARWVLEYYQYGVYGSDAPNRLVELRGLDHYIERARSEEWLIRAGNVYSRARDVAAHYGIPQTPIALRDDPYTFAKTLTAVIGTYEERGHTRQWSAVGQAPDGRWFAARDKFNGGSWRLLTAEECAALGLDMTPPATPPQLPPAQPLPSAEEVAARNRRFAALFFG